MAYIIKRSLLITLLFSLNLLVNASAADFKNGVTHINQQELIEKLKSPNTVLIDIRSQEEVDDGYIPGAVHVPITEVMKDISLLDEHLNKDIIFYCHVGTRVRALTDYLLDIGHPSKDKLYHLKGDIRAWRARGKKLIKK